MACVIPVAQFKRVQARLPSGPRTERHPKAVYPLSGLVYCGHCGKTMTGNAHKYFCTTYLRRGRQNESGCGRHTVHVGQIEKWLVEALRQFYLDPGRAEGVEEIRRQLKAEAKSSRADCKRLEKRGAELDKEIGRLVKAIRTTERPGTSRGPRRGPQGTSERPGKPTSTRAEGRTAEEASTRRLKVLLTSYGGLRRGYPTASPP